MLKFGCENKALDGTLTAYSSDSAYPVSNLQQNLLEPPHRTTGVSFEWIKWNWSTAISPDLVVIERRHNYTDGATVKFQMNGSDSWASPPVNITLSVAAGEPIIYQFSSPPSYAWARFTLQDASNPDGYFETPYIYIGSIVQLTASMRGFLRSRPQISLLDEVVVQPDLQGNPTEYLISDEHWQIGGSLVNVTENDLDALLALKRNQRTAGAGPFILIYKGVARLVRWVNWYKFTQQLENAKPTYSIPEIYFREEAGAA